MDAIQLKKAFSDMKAHVSVPFSIAYEVVETPVTLPKTNMIVATADSVTTISGHNKATTVYLNSQEIK